MTDSTRIALAQCNFCVGDIDGNCEKIIAVTEQARRDHEADLVMFPELALTGYPPEDLLFRPGLYRRVDEALNKIRNAVTATVVIGYPERCAKETYNSAIVFSKGTVVANYRKQKLPNYAVFDEKRYFLPGDESCVFEHNGIRMGLSICEDVWNPDTAQTTARAGAEVLLNLNASPFHMDKVAERQAAVSRAAQAAQCPVVYLNTVGGQDELIFDGASFAINKYGTVCAQFQAFKETLAIVEVTRDNNGIIVHGDQCELPELEQSVYEALVLGIKDYVHKNHFPGCVLGLSGGIDSALTLALAVDALGADAVTAVSMPSRYTASMSIDDARAQTERLQCSFEIIEIEPIVDAFRASLSSVLPENAPNITFENLQARSRGVLLMGISNASGKMVLATGNKSEMAVGYATLYGDMAGGFAPLKDIPKLLVYRLAEWRNRYTEIIPQRVIDRAPSAELAPDQKDSDSLPPYDILDPILEHYIEHDLTPREIADLGFDLATAKRVARMVDRNEYKRRQAAPGVRITKRAFGRDRRFPITSGYNEQIPVAGKS